jgi:hypothetical protein
VTGKLCSAIRDAMPLLAKIVKTLGEGDEDVESRDLAALTLHVRAAAQSC